MSSQLKLAITGANGRMGRALQELLRDDFRFELVATFARDDDWRKAPRLDVVIDFSTPDGFDAALAHCTAHRVAFVSGTTGLGEKQCRAMGEAARAIPVLHVANFSLGIAVLTKLLREATRALPDWDLEILEAHHAKKADAPSGTALALGRAAAEARAQDFDKVAVLSRAGWDGARPHGAIGFASLRVGDIAGEHTAMLASTGERLELTHRASDRAIFARGALAAAAWLVGREPGVYTMRDVIGQA